jgi:hypothetical protein
LRIDTLLELPQLLRQGYDSKYCLRFSSSTMMISLTGSCYISVRRYHMKHESFQHGLDYGMANQAFGRWISGSGSRFFTSPKRPERIMETTHLPN